MPRAVTEELRAGSGILEVAYVRGRAAATRAAATYPLKFLIPRRPGPVAWVYTSTCGGGLVAGDAIDIAVRVGPEVACVMSTQSSTKVYKSSAGLGCRQSLQATVAERATLILAPDPVTCFADARYQQDQQIHLHDQGMLIAIDWLTSGRWARGERWAFSSYRSRLDVYLGGRQILADALLLDPQEGSLGSPFRLGRFNCLALVVLVGERLADRVETLLAEVGRRSPARQAAVVEAVSPISHGAVLRVVGETPELVAQHLRHTLSFLVEELGDPLWARKW